MDSNRVISDAIILHLQAVPVSGYPMQLTKKLGVCKGMLDKCSTELRTLGSSGQLKKYRKQFSYIKSTLGASMSAEQDSSPPPKMSVEDIVAKHGQMLEDHGKQLGEMGKTMGSMGEQLGEIIKNTSNKPGSNYPGTDNSKGQTTGAAKPTGPAGTQSGTYGSQGETEMVQVSKTDLLTLQTELANIKTTVEAREKEFEEKERSFESKQRAIYAKTIAQGEAFTKEITPDKIDERTKFWMEFKDGTGNLADLSLLATKYEGMKSRTYGSSGKSDEDIFFSMESVAPTLGASGGKPTRSILEQMEDFK